MLGREGRGEGGWAGKAGETEARPQITRSWPGCGHPPGYLLFSLLALRAERRGREARFPNTHSPLSSVSLFLESPCRVGES